MSSAIVLIGAGASVDAGMPLVAKLTKELRTQLPNVRDMNGRQRPEFAELFDAIAEYEPAIRENYERFFEWLTFILRAQTGTFSKMAKLRIDRRLVDAVPYLVWSIKRPIWEILRSRHQCERYEPHYYARLRALLPPKGRLKVFTTNYDLCVEDACRLDGLDVITGFQAGTGRWCPSLLRSHTQGISLYKLHGSLNWGLKELGPANPLNRPLVERYPPDWRIEPELVLGPGSKLQPEEPFVTLYAAFHQALRRAKSCVVIGCSFQDPHIEEPLRKASLRGMRVIDVNPSPSVRFDRYASIPMGAKKALESDTILKAVS